MSVFSPSGTILASNAGYKPDWVHKMLEQALEKFDPKTEPKKVERLDTDGGVLSVPDGGLITAKGRVSQFELVAKGWGERARNAGFSAALTVAPEGQLVPVVLLVRLADPADPLARIIPHRTRNGDFVKH